MRELALRGREVRLLKGISFICVQRSKLDLSFCVNQQTHLSTCQSMWWSRPQKITDVFKQLEKTQESIIFWPATEANSKVKLSLRLLAG